MNNELLDDDFEIELTNLSNDRIKEINLAKINANDRMRDVRYGRNALWVLSAITFLFTGIGLLNNSAGVGTREILLEGLIFIGIYGACAYGVKINAKVALIIGLLVYLLLMALYTLVDISTLYSRIPLKLLMIYYLVKGILAAVALAKDKIKLKGLGVPTLELDSIDKLIDIPKTIRPFPGSN